MKKIKFAWDAMDNYFTTICSRQNQIKNESQSQSMDKFNKYPMMIVR
jgi:phosphoketolase